MPITQPKVSQAGDLYTVEHSKAFIGGFIMTMPDIGKTADIVAIYPQGVTGLTLNLNIVGAGKVDLATVTGTTSVGSGADQYDLAVSRNSLPGNREELVCNISNPSGHIGQKFELRARVSGTPVDWGLKLGGHDNGDSVLGFLACDPQAKFVHPLPGATVLEQDNTLLEATQVDAGSVLGTLPETEEWQPHYTWHFSGPIAITALPHTTTKNSEVDLGNTYMVQMPGVYEPVPIQLTLKTSFGDPSNPNKVPFLTNEVASEDQPKATIAARPQHVALVLDRSDSMNQGRKWETAVQAARVFTHLLAAFRDGVQDDDKLGVVTFTADKRWPEISDTSRILTPVALSRLADAKTAVGNDLGSPEGLTPLGDGLVAGLDLLATGAGTANRRFTLVALTDGLENAGSVYVGPTVPDTGGQPVSRFQTGSLNDAAHGQRNAVRDEFYGANKAGRLFAIGLGPDVDQAVLKSLANEQGFTPVAGTQDLAKAFARILAFSQEVATIAVTNKPGDPAAYPAVIDKKTGRVAFAVLGDFPVGHSLKVEASTDGGTTWNALPGSLVKTTRTDTFMVASVPAFSKVPGNPTLWRMTHLDAAAPSAAVPIAKDDVLAFVDVQHIKAAVQLDNSAYLTGDDMELTVRVRNDDKLVRGAKVRAELVAPAIGTGSALSEIGADFDADDAGFAADEDTPPLHGRMIREALHRNQWDHWPQEDPDDGLFEDGTDELHDVDGDGNYTNTFARVWKEGAYTWNLFVDGKDTDGNPFNRVITVSTFAGIKVSRRATTVTLVPIKDHPSKLRAVRVIVTPQDVRHERLGPNKDHVVFWELHNGTFEHVFNHEHPPVLTDGTYQRVVLYRQGDCPSLRVEAAGVLLPTIRIPFWVLNSAG
ncbi:hypothetical protein [Streptomyces melanogenes]|uniref:hypothetical protein n=1 Tax=Streptomyces melanogenes TaxID=67326 RepID=UPI00378ADB56